MVLLHKPRPTFREQLHVHAFDICAALGWQLGDMFRHVPQFASLRGMLQKPLQDRRPRFLGCLAVVFWFHGSSGSNAARRGCHCSHGSVMEALRISSAVVPADAVAQEVEAKDDAAAAVTHVEESEAGPLKVFVCSDEFEIACGCAICFSVFVICLQTDSVDLPFLIQFSESMVTAFFLLEWCLRDSEHLLDTFIVWCPGVIVVWIMQPLQIEAEASDLFKFFRIARMLRFVQLVKAFKHVGAFEDLWKLVRGLVSSGGTLASAMSLIVFNLYVFAIFCCELIGFQQFPVDASDGAKEAQERFKGISASMLTLTRFMHGDDSQGIMDALVEELPWIWIFLWLFTAMSSFVLLNLVTAVIVQQAMDMSKGDEKEMAILRKREQEREMKELEEMFREIDEDGSGIVSLAEFKEAFKDPAICDKFLMLGLKEEQAMELFSLLDTGGEGELDLSEFMQGMSQLKGVAKNKDEDVCTLSQALYTCRFFWSTWEDMVMLTKGIERLGKGIIRMGEGMGLHGLKDEHENDGVNGKLEPLRSSCPFLEQEARLHLPYDISNAVYLEEPLFSYMLRYVSKSVQDAKSIRADMGKGRGLGADDDEIDDLLVMVKGKGKVGGASRKRRREVQMPSGNIGLGWHSFDFQWDEGKTCKVTVVLQRIGHPTGDGPSFFSSLVLFVEGTDQMPLLKLCQKAWPGSVKRPLLDDLEWFLKDETRTFYAKHGIPYHRCYLLHGEPGTGKTSFMNSVAGHIQRNLCFIQMDKHMTDDTFRNAMTQLPALSMVVLEDVDALFTNHREADHNNSSLSFSGFLNCLDGLGAPDDVVIFMTTNHPDKLDPAVMRPGRIDLKAENKDVASKYFLTFYPGAEDAAASFGTSVGGRISERKVSMAQLQHFFLACHRQGFDAAKAAEYISVARIFCCQGSARVQPPTALVLRSEKSAQCAERGEGKLKERVGKLRSKVRERLQKSEDEMLRLSSRMDRMLKQTEVAIRRIKTGQPAGSGQADSSKDDLAKSRSRRRDGDKKEKDSKEQKELKDRKEKDGRNVPSLRGPSWLGLAAFGSSSGEGRADVVMPRRSDSRSDSRPRRGSGRGRSRSAKRGRRDDSRDRGRRGGRSRSDGGRPGEALSEWGTSGVIVDLKGSGFGFIRPDTGKVNDKDLYFHCTAVNKSVPFDELRVNDEVNYEAVRDDRKGHPTAKNVTLKNGGSSSKRKDSRSTSRRR
eukprot:s4385_g4.t2